MPYRCEKCGGRFVRPETYIDCLTIDPPIYERRAMSPCCGDGFYEVAECPVCNEFTASKHPGGICAGCARDAAHGLKESLGKMSISEIRYLDHLLDGVSLEEFRDGK